MGSEDADDRIHLNPEAGEHRMTSKFVEQKPQTLEGRNRTLWVPGGPCR